MSTFTSEDIRTDVASGRASSKGDKSGIPAAGTPFSPANGSYDPVTHGATSPTIYGERANVIAAQLLDVRPDLAAFPSAVRSWAIAEARAELLREHEARVGLLDDDDPKAFTKLSMQIESQLDRARQRLGLDPIAAMQLQSARATAAVQTIDLQQVAAQGRAVLEQRRAELAAQAEAESEAESPVSDEEESA